MSIEGVNSAQVMDALAALRREVARLSERIAALEGATTIKPAAAASAMIAAPVRSVEAAGMSEELILVISAAVAAFLGKRPHIRQIRLVGSTAWAQQGRVTIQASHTHEPGTGGSQH